MTTTGGALGAAVDVAADVDVAAVGCTEAAVLLLVVVEGRLDRARCNRRSSARRRAMASSAATSRLVGGGATPRTLAPTRLRMLPLPVVLPVFPGVEPPRCFLIGGALVVVRKGDIKFGSGLLFFMVTFCFCPELVLSFGFLPTQNRRVVRYSDSCCTLPLAK